MKNIKRLLYSFVLTSSILFSAINVFAGPGDGSGATAGAQAGMDCLSVMQQIAEETITINKQVTDKVVHEVDEDFSGGSTLNPGNPTKKIILSKMTGTWQ